MIDPCPPTAALHEATEPLLCAECLRAGSAALLAGLDPHGLGAPARAPARLTVRGLIAHAARLTGASAEEITGERRWARLIVARRAIAVVARWATAKSYPEIGAVLGGRDHSTMIHAFTRGEEKVAEDPEFAWLVERLWAAAECDVFCSRTAVAEPVAEPEIDWIEGEAVIVAEPWRAPPERPGEYRARHALPLTPDMIDPDNAGLRSVRAGCAIAGAA